MNKEFDCVEMKHKAAIIINKKISKMSRKEELEYWQDISKEMKEEQKKLKSNIKVSFRRNVKSK